MCPTACWGAPPWRRAAGKRLTPPAAPAPLLGGGLQAPTSPISTPELFARADRVKLRCRPDTARGARRPWRRGIWAGWPGGCTTYLRDVLPPRLHTRVAEIKNILVQCGALGANMSGSGPTAFGLFDSLAGAQEARDRLAERYRDTFLCETV